MEFYKGVVTVGKDDDDDDRIEGSTHPSIIDCG